jgi:hypothetical protein
MLGQGVACMEASQRRAKGKHLLPPMELLLLRPQSLPPLPESRMFRNQRLPEGPFVARADRPRCEVTLEDPASPLPLACPVPLCHSLYPSMDHPGRSFLRLSEQPPVADRRALE